MKKKLLFLFAVSLFGCVASSKKVLIPVQNNQFTWIYKPEGDTFPGPSTQQLEAGKFYDEWVPNDHTFIKGPDGKWHIFGITHPVIDPMINVHEGEFLSFHAKEPETGFLTEKGWLDLPNVLPPAERPGEIPENHAPYIIQKDELYYMVYGPNPMRMAVSKDLKKWELKGNLFYEAKGARDPSLIYYDNQYHIIYCTEKKVKIRSSEDLMSWSESNTIFESVAFDPESPSVVRYNNTFYLFVCSWDGVWDKKDIQGAYQHKTYVYQSDRIEDFKNRDPITVLNAHAPEIFEYQQQWYISSVEWPNRGVSIDELDWK